MVVIRTENSGGIREPGFQKEFGLATSAFGFEIFPKLNRKNVSEMTA